MKHLSRSLLVAAALAFGAPAMAAEQTVTLNVPGMFCDACPAIVKGSLAKVAGVTRVEASFERKTAVVTFDDAKASVADLIKATTNAGYPSTPVGRGS
ncbi:MAG TPA: mercury resistance system periplasmic binding protein MerP [Propylenella sp.]